MSEFLVKAFQTNDIKLRYGAKVGQVTILAETDKELRKEIDRQLIISRNLKQEIEKINKDYNNG